MAARESILIFDSGLGGLTVHREVRAARPHADILYVADDAAFPYNALKEPALVTRVCALMGDLITTASARSGRAGVQHRFDDRATRPSQEIFFANRRYRTGDQARLRGVGYAPRLRARHAGYDRPRIYPCADSRLRAGMRGHACRLESLRAMPRPSLPARPSPMPRLRAEIERCFVEDGQRTDTIVLACTHYPLLIGRLRQVAPWPVNFIDPAPAIARRVSNLLGPADLKLAARPRTRHFHIWTPTAAVLACFGIDAHEPAEAAAESTYNRFDRSRLSP